VLCAWMADTSYQVVKELFDLPVIEVDVKLVLDQLVEFVCEHRTNSHKHQLVTVLMPPA
jgi:hypothetical protein